MVNQPRLISLIIVTTLITNNLAFCEETKCPNSVVLKKGDTVKDCDRVGLEKEYAKQVEEDLIIADFNKKIAEDEKKLNETKDTRIKESEEQAEMWKAEDERTRAKLLEEQNRGKTDFWIGLTVGMLTILAGALAIKTAAK